MEILVGSNAGKGLKKTRSFGARQGHPLRVRVRARMTSEFGLNILDEALHFPVLLLKESALAYNLKAMAGWCAANNFLIAPHGKTTMTPRIFERQMDAGAWQSLWRPHRKPLSVPRRALSAS
jgi:D-serine dehydratase